MSKTPKADAIMAERPISREWKTRFNLAINLAKLLEAENVELRQQVESMKCCENCKYAGNTLWDDYSEPCNDCSKDASKWEPRA